MAARSHMPPRRRRRSPRTRVVKALVDLCALLWDLELPPVIQICGGTAPQRAALAAAACARLGRVPFSPRADTAEALADAWEGAVGHEAGVLFAEADDPARAVGLSEIMDLVPAPAILGGLGIWTLRTRAMVRFELRPPRRVAPPSVRRRARTSMAAESSQRHLSCKRGH